jgi:hypothetical protein
MKMKAEKRIREEETSETSENHYIVTEAPDSPCYCPESPNEEPESKKLKSQEYQELRQDFARLQEKYNQLLIVMEKEFTAKAFYEPIFRVKKLSTNATLPTRGSTEAAGYDVYSACDAIVPASGTVTIPLNIAIQLPDGHFAKMYTRSSLGKQGIEVGAGNYLFTFRGSYLIRIIRWGFSR